MHQPPCADDAAQVPGPGLASCSCPRSRLLPSPHRNPPPCPPHPPSRPLCWPSSANATHFISGACVGAGSCCLYFHVNFVYKYVLNSGWSESTSTKAERPFSHLWKLRTQPRVLLWTREEGGTEGWQLCWIPASACSDRGHLRSGLDSSRTMRTVAALAWDSPSPQ